MSWNWTEEAPEFHLLPKKIEAELLNLNEILEFQKVAPFRLQMKVVLTNKGISGEGVP